LTHTNSGPGLAWRRTGLVCAPITAGSSLIAAIDSEAGRAPGARA
jgi:hypothetical protein